jgi:hypothetical protein
LKRLKGVRQFNLGRIGGTLKLRINILAIIGALFGLLSASLTWLTSDELQAIRSNSGSVHTFPDSVIPNLSLVGLCDTGWIFSHDLGFALAALLFFAGTILAFYTSLGGIVQVAGYVAYFRTFDSAQAAVVSGLPSGAGPKIALISIILVITSLLFPVFVWSKAKLKGFWRRFLTVTPEKNVKQEVSLLYASGGSVVILWGLVVRSSSIYEKGNLSATLFVVAGLILLATAMAALVMSWKSE